VNVRFIEPVPAKRTGGLEAAIASLASALPDVGVTAVRDNGFASASDDAEIFHFHGLWDRRASRMASKLRRGGKRYVISAHGMLEPWAWRHKAWKKWPYYYLIERRFIAGAAFVLGTAQSEANAIRQFLPAAKVLTIPLGLTAPAVPDYGTARAKLGWQPEELVLLFLARLHVKKGLDLLLDALSQIPQVPHARLVIVGGGEPSYVQHIRKWADGLRNSLPQIDWIGEVWGEARWPYFQGADLFCLPSRSENFGLAVLEALQVGTPVLTTNATPWPEYIHGRRGLIASPTISSVRDELRYFFQQRCNYNKDRAQLAEWAHSTFSWAVLAPRYRAFYEQALETSDLAIRQAA
jgi:glycosyltransferase involved in cell wall biosynthesis